MKLVTAIIQDRDIRQVTDSLIGQGFQVTQNQTMGAFLQEKNATLFTAVDDDQVETVISIIEENSKTRTQIATPIIDIALVNTFETGATEIEIGGATIFVQNIEQFKKI